MNRIGMNRSPFLWLFVVALGGGPGWAATAVVPTDHATIQSAVNAVQGTAGALVRIDSNATFVETVTATLSVAIEGGAGFTPTLEGTLVGCDFLGGCAVNFNPTGAGATSFELRRLRVVPSAVATPDSGHRMVQIHNEGSASATLLAEELVLDDPNGSGGGAFYSRVGPPNTGTNDVTVRDTSIQLGGAANFSAVALTLEEQGSLTVERVTVVMTDSSGTAFLVRGAQGNVVFELRDSLFDVAAPADAFSSRLGVVSHEVDATIERNRFLLRGGSPGSVEGIRASAAAGTDLQIQLDANEFVGLGGGLGDALEADAFDDGTVAVVATNNVMRSFRSGIVLSPQSAGPSSGGTVTATLTNNTIDGSSGNAISLDTQIGTSTAVEIFNNLLTNSGGFGVGLSDGGGALAATLRFNGFFANASGNVQPPLTAQNSVSGDPLYLASDDLRLTVGSPMLDAGSNAAPEITALDAAQQPRIQNGVVDIGAYEGAFVAPLSGLEIPTLGSWRLVILALALGLLGAARLAGRPA